MDIEVYTIGHSNHSPEDFVRLLKTAEVEVLVDVRSNPGSPWVSYATPHELKRILEAEAIRYLYLGDVLGGRPDDADCYDSQTGRPDYRKIRSRTFFRQGIGRLLEGAREYRVCLMCAEENPSSCHRDLLVGDSLRREGVRVLHIRGSGAFQTDEELWKEKAGVDVSQFSLPLGDAP